MGRWVLKPKMDISGSDQVGNDVSKAVGRRLTMHLPRLKNFVVLATPARGLAALTLVGAPVFTDAERSWSGSPDVRNPNTGCPYRTLYASQPRNHIDHRFSSP